MPFKWHFLPFLHGEIKILIYSLYFSNRNILLKICVRSMAQVSDCISHMIKGMEARPDVVGVACEALHKMFDKNHTELVAQVNKKWCLS